MNLKNISIILAFLSLKVISSPINDIVSEGEETAVEIQEVEISSDEIVTVNVNDDSILEDDDSDSELEIPEIPSGSVNGNNDDIISDLPCNDFNDCVDWLGNNMDTLNLFVNPKLTNDTLQYLRNQYQDGKAIEILQQKYDAINYGIKVDVNGHKMSVNIKGEENEKTIVLLPGLGIVNTVIFYKNITDSLSTDYKVVTLEPFGYGLSDLVKEERTAENIVKEIHDCLQKLGINKFYLMGHSIGGIYSLIYDNTYPGELLGFIGLDNTPSNYDIPVTVYPDLVNSFFVVLDKYHMYELFPEETKKQLNSLELELQYQNYSEKELEYSEIINIYKSNNPNVMNENELSSANIQATKGLYFQCPILMFIATDTVNMAKDIGMDWVALHKNMIVNSENSEMITLEGVHAFLHTQQKDYISNKIKEWIN